MAIIIRLDVILAERKVRSRELASRIGMSEVNLSMLKTGRMKGIRFESLDKICAALDCQPGDIMIHVPDDEDTEATTANDGEE